MYCIPIKLPKLCQSEGLILRYKINDIYQIMEQKTKETDIEIDTSRE